MGLERVLPGPAGLMQGLILAVRERMPDNPYHGWAHVVDVTQVPAARGGDGVGRPATVRAPACGAESCAGPPPPHLSRPH